MSHKAIANYIMCNVYLELLFLFEKHTNTHKKGGNFGFNTKAHIP